MIRAHLGESIDIHAGGRDLIFPHHENERAQSCCAYDDDFVRYWMHNAYVDMDGEKMSKSLGNVRTVRELGGRYPGEVLRFALLTAHYRSPLNFSVEVLEQCARCFRRVLWCTQAAIRGSTPPELHAVDTAVYGALLDDINTPEAIATLHAAAKTLNKASDTKAIADAKAELLVGGGASWDFLAKTPRRGFSEGMARRDLPQERLRR